MIFKQVAKNSKSPYAIFLDNDQTINLEAMSDISKITNSSEFISHVQELSKYDIDFSDLSADDLIIEGSEIAEDLAKDLENEELTEEELKTTEEKADTTIKKMGILCAIGGAIGGAASTAISKIRNALSKRKIKQIEQKTENGKENNIESQGSEVNHKPVSNTIPFDEICPRVDVDEAKVLREMNSHKQQDAQKNRATDTYGDGDPDGDDIDL